MKWLDDGCRLRTSCSSSRDWFMRMDSGGGVRELGDRRICMTSRMLMVIGPTTLTAHRCRLGSGQCVG